MTLILPRRKVITSLAALGAASLWPGVARASSLITRGAMSATGFGFGHKAAGGVPNKKLYSFGRNNFGQLGKGNTTTYYSPTQVGSGTTWASVSAGSYHSLARFK